MPQSLLDCRSLLTGSAAASSLAASAPPAPLPNIILILTDNLGYGDLGCYGSTKHQTPHIDRLAREGMRFTNCLAASGWNSSSTASVVGSWCCPDPLHLKKIRTII
jgi:hypothetical protein